MTTNKGEGNKIAVPIQDLETNSGFNQNNVVHDVNGISRTLIGQGHCGNEPKVAIPVLTPDRGTKRQNGRRFKEDGEEAFTLTSQDRHGVAVEVKPQVIGDIGEKNFGKQWRQGNRVYDAEKVATALESHHVGNAGGNTNLYAVEINVEPVQMSGRKLSESKDEAHTLNCTDQQKIFGANQVHTMVGYNATLKRGGGMTDTALALCARDCKGLSGSNQMMTAAAMCLRLTKESGQKKEKSQTASGQEKTVDSANITNKEH